jgi:hypothetical protein
LSVQRGTQPPTRGLGEVVLTIINFKV